MYDAYYLRASSRSQDTVSQEKDMRDHASRQDGETRFFTEIGTGTNYDRGEWQKLWRDVQAGRVRRLVVWRLDRLGRTAAQTIQLLDDLERIGVQFVSIRDGFDPSTPAGRLTRNVLASVAQFETEVRAERQAAGIAAAKAAGKQWGGRKVGTRVKVTEEKERTMRRMAAEGTSISEIARVLDLTRRTVYRTLDKPV